MRCVLALTVVATLAGCGGAAAPPASPPPPENADTCVPDCVTAARDECANDSLACTDAYLAGQCLASCGHPMPATWSNDTECIGFCNASELDACADVINQALMSGYDGARAAPALTAACTAALGG